MIREMPEANDIAALLEAARQGFGDIGFGESAMARDFATGVLVQLLPKWRFDSDSGIYLVRPSHRFMPARTDAFVMWIGTVFEGASPWHGLPR